ncbi:MAG: hypothetical protein FJX74_19225, partial [Armatimonadetes bacterium]|nr:hypothetical protein [Armatimonadota bacterium]
MRRYLCLWLTLPLTAPATAQAVKPPRAKTPLTLCTFETDEAVERWTGLPVERVEIDGHGALRFAFPQWQEGANEWPAVYLAYDEGRGFVATDWSHYAELVLEVQIDGEQVGDLAVELRDAVARNGHALHYNVEPGGRRQITVSLEDAAGEIELEHVQQIVLYATQPAHSYSVTVASMTLLPGERPPLATFALGYPNYRGLILPRVDRVEVSAVLQPEEYEVPPGDLHLEVAAVGGGKRVAETRRLPETSGGLAVW